MNVLKLLCANAPVAGGQTLAFRSSATSTASTITAPSDIVAGDLIVWYNRATSTSATPTSVVPSGFTSILDQAHAGLRRTICAFKIATGSEAGATITGMSGGAGGSQQVILFVFSTNGATSAISYDVAFEFTDNDPTAQVVNAASGSTPLVVLAFMRQQTATGQSLSPTEDGSSGNIGNNYGFYKIYNSSPADVTADCGDGGTSNALMSFYIEVN
jgi:hypothetical protein